MRFTCKAPLAERWGRWGRVPIYHSDWTLWREKGGSYRLQKGDRHKLSPGNLKQDSPLQRHVGIKWKPSESLGSMFKATGLLREGVVCWRKESCRVWIGATVLARLSGPSFHYSYGIETLSPLAPSYQQRYGSFHRQETGQISRNVSLVSSSTLSSVTQCAWGSQAAAVYVRGEVPRPRKLLDPLTHTGSFHSHFQKHTIDGIVLSQGVPGSIKDVMGKHSQWRAQSTGECQVAMNPFFHLYSPSGSSELGSSQATQWFNCNLASVLLLGWNLYSQPPFTITLPLP